MQNNNQLNYSFPRIKKIKLNSFSLYGLNTNVEVPFDGGVLCLAGANGIGKSTFLSTANYALTGAVPHPRRRLLSLQAYYKDASDYAKDFFAGRINENDRDEATVTIEFKIGTESYKITRGLFDPEDVRLFEINGVEDIPTSLLFLTPLQRSDHYRKVITQAIGVMSFEQFVFIQHFIFTFDEARHLLFWDEDATAQSLFLCFGSNPESAARADFLYREAEKAGSRGRNIQFQINNINKRLQHISESLNIAKNKPAGFDDLDAQYQSLEKELKDCLMHSENAQARLFEVDLKITQQSAKIATLKASYNEVFNQLLNKNTKTASHPLIANALRDSICGICETSGDTVKKFIQNSIDKKTCPLCGSEVCEDHDLTNSLSNELAKIDEQLSAARDSLDELVLTQQRIAKEEIQARERTLKAKEAVTQFESINQDVSEIIKAQQLTKVGPVAQTIEALQKTILEFITARDAEYAQRDKLRSELKNLQKELEYRYAHAEETFVPRFRQLAGLFLGIDLDVSLQLIAPVGVKLVVEMRGNARLDENQMSESQRFFVDIALRMALAQQVSQEGALATLFIDTPEGSLDIAYEDRAGEMFAQFVQSGHDMIMTANINSSKLLKTLAKNCGNKHMSLNQMTGWAELSDVQQKATHLFQEAYDDILKLLKEGPIKQQ